MRKSPCVHMVAMIVAALTVRMPAKADTSQLALSSLIQYSTVIQGAVDPIYAYVYNYAPPGSDAGAYKVTAAYGYEFSSSLGSYMGTKAADGGASYVTLPFGLKTLSVSPGTVPVQVTLTNRVTDQSLNQTGQVTVLAHAAPGLYFQGKIVPLVGKPAVIEVPPAADAFCQAPPAGTEGTGGGFAPQMLGDPPGEPTAELDLDSISSFGSPFITTTLTPFTDLPSNDNPAQSIPFRVNFCVPRAGDYNTTFLLHYSDQQGLPGADPPGSELASFNVNVDVTSKTYTAIITTDAVPEPGTAALTLAGCEVCVLVGALLRVCRR
jgi:hypothetical protein